jgi:hypothetical protein
MLRALVLSLVLATPLQAEWKPVWSVASDLDGDGAAEGFALRDNGDGAVDLVITTGQGTITAPAIAWLGGIGQQPDLALAPNGSVLLSSRNDAIGRSRWTLTLTIAYRRGAYRVAGFTYGWYDTLDLPDNGLCDINLLNGRGTVAIDGGPARAIAAPFAAPEVTAWSDDFALPPDACQ